MNKTSTHMDQLALFGGPKYIKTPIRDTGAYFGPEKIKRVVETLESGHLSYFTNPIVKEFEEKFCQKIKADHAVATSSCTAALHAAALALNIKKGDEVLVPSYTYAASLNPFLLHGAAPVFVDVDVDTCCMNTDGIQDLISSKTRAIVAVHLFGNTCDIAALSDIAHDNDIILIEDCAQALGATFKGQYTGTWGDIGCFSFFENKHLPTGEGGMIVMNDSQMEHTIRGIINEGEYCEDGTPALSLDSRPPFTYTLRGLNYRMSAVTAAAGISQVEDIDVIVEKRNEVATHYSNHFADCEYLQFFPNTSPDMRPAHFVGYTLFCRQESSTLGRDGFIKLLNAEGVPAMRYYPQPLHAYFTTSQALPNTSRVSQFNICFPCHPLVTEDQIKAMRGAINKVVSAFEGQHKEGLQ